VVWGAAERLNHGVAEDAARRMKRGGGAGGLRGVAGLGLGHRVIKGLFCRAAEWPRRAGRARGSPGFSGGRCASGKKGEGEDGETGRPTREKGGRPG
jgi:hypothetical protein